MNETEADRLRAILQRIELIAASGKWPMHKKQAMIATLTRIEEIAAEAVKGQRPHTHSISG